MDRSLLVRHAGPSDGSVMAFTVRAGKITHIDIIRDDERMRQLDLSVLGD